MKKRIANYYQKHYDEQGRLLRDSRKIELVRTQEIMKRYLPSLPARILDVGGGAGIYSAWLAKLGYNVHLVDIVPLHSHNDCPAHTVPTIPLVILILTY